MGREWRELRGFCAAASGGAPPPTGAAALCAHRTAQLAHAVSPLLRRQRPNVPLADGETGCRGALISQERQVRIASQPASGSAFLLRHA